MATSAYATKDTEDEEKGAKYNESQSGISNEVCNIEVVEIAIHSGVLQSFGQLAVRVL